MWVAQLRETPRNRQHGKIGRITFGNFVPVKRCGYARIRQRAHGIRGARRTVFRVLVVIEKHAVPLLLPPLRGGEGRYPPLDRTRKRERGAPHFDERPARFNPRIHVHSTRTARFRPASKPHLLEKRFHFESDTAHIVPPDARPRIQIDAQFVRVVEVGSADSVRMELDRAQVHNPNQSCGIIHNDLFRFAPRRK